MSDELKYYRELLKLAVEEIDSALDCSEAKINDWMINDPDIHEVMTELMLTIARQPVKGSN